MHLVLEGQRLLIETPFTITLVRELWSVLYERVLY